MQITRSSVAGVVAPSVAILPDRKTTVVSAEERVKQVSLDRFNSLPPRTSSEQLTTVRRLDSLDLAQSGVASATKSQKVFVGINAGKKHEVVQHELVHHSDLLTSGDKKATEHAKHILDCLVCTMSRAGLSNRIVMEAAVKPSGQNSGTRLDEFCQLMKSFEDLLADPTFNPLDNEDDLVLLNEIIDLMTKCLSAGKGGVGSFKADPTKWKSEWDSLSKDDPSANVVKLKEMVTYMRENAPDHFSTDQQVQHHAKLELNIVQFDAFVGGLVVDFLCNPKIKSHEKLGTHLAKNDVVSQQRFTEVDGLRSKMRSNPLLAETKTGKIYNKMKIELDQYVEQQLKELNAKITPPLSEEKLMKLKQQVMDELDKQTKPHDQKSSARGRTDLTTGKALAVHLRGQQAADVDIANFPDAASNQLAYADVKTRLQSVPGSGIASFDQALPLITKHGAAPSTVLRLGTALESGLHDLAETPDSVLSRVIGIVATNPSQGEEEKKLCQELQTKIRDDAGSLKAKIGGLSIHYNDNSPTQTMPLAELATLPSIASTMRAEHLRTICSISGTTTDIALGIAARIGKDGLHDLLEPLLQHAKDLKDGKAKEFDNEQFAELFSRIVFFMHCGKYHTSAEVLGGLLIAAMSSADSADIPPKEVFEMFGLLMKDFSINPQNYFPLSAEDKKILFGADSQSGMKQLHEASVTRARENIEQGSSMGIVPTRATVLTDISDKLDQLITQVHRPSEENPNEV